MSTILKSQFHFYAVNQHRTNVVYVTPNNRHFYVCGISPCSNILRFVNDFDEPSVKDMRNLYNYIVAYGVKHNKKFTQNINFN